MKKKITITILVGLGLFLSATQVFGAVSYERTPAEFEILNPVNFSLSGIFDTYPAENSWRLRVRADDAVSEYSECIILSTTTIEMILPYKTYLAVSFEAWSNVECSGERDIEINVEYNGNEPIFEVIPPPPPPPFLELTDSFPAGIIGYVRAFVGSGLAPFLAMVIGLPFAFVVIRKVIALVPKK